jgi:DNA polymerase eta
MLPTLKDVPCAVQQHQDIIAVSYEARALGVTKHMPPTQVRQKYPTVKLVHVAQRGTSGKVTYRNYRQASKVIRTSTAHTVLLPTHVVMLLTASLSCTIHPPQSIFTLVAAHCSLLEKASIDEAYLAPTLAELAPYLAPAALAALQGLPGSAKQHQHQQQQQPVSDELAEALLDAGAAFALHIQTALRDSLQYQCSVGVAENKLLAKLATAEAKPAGVFALQRRRVTAFLNETPVTALPGCGPDSATGAAFKHAGVQCIADLQRADVEAIVRQAEAVVSDFLLCKGSC